MKQNARFTITFAGTAAGLKEAVAKEIYRGIQWGEDPYPRTRNAPNAFALSGVIEALDAVYALGESTAPAIEQMLARDKLTNATVALDEHLAEHGCMRQTFHLSSKGYD